MDRPEPTVDKNADGGDRGGARIVQAWLAGIAIGALILAAMVVSYEIGTNNADDSNAVQPPGQAAEEPAAAPAAVPPPAAAGPGSDLFVASCGSCHTLSAAGTDGAAGPNLDDLQPDAALVASAIEAGGTGSGAMPAGLLSGEDAQDVADYVAASSGASK